MKQYTAEQKAEMRKQAEEWVNEGKPCQYIDFISNCAERPRPISNEQAKEFMRGDWDFDENIRELLWLKGSDEESILSFVRLDLWEFI